MPKKENSLLIEELPSEPPVATPAEKDRNFALQPEGCKRSVLSAFDFSGQDLQIDNESPCYAGLCRLMFCLRTLFSSKKPSAGNRRHGQ